MAKVKLTQSFLLSVEPEEGKSPWYSDAVTRGLRLYVGAKGKKTWYVYYRRKDGKTAHEKIGDAALISLAEARTAAMEFLSALARGETPYLHETPAGKMTLGKFVRDIYSPWVLENRRSGRETIAMLKSSFIKLWDMNMEDIDLRVVESWRSSERSAGLKVSSINRKLTALKSVLNWAFKREFIAAYPLSRLETLREEDDHRVRYLSDDERKRLFKALDKREEDLRAARKRYNKWLKERGLPFMPAIKKDEFADHLKPLVLLSLNTGIRRGSLLALRWSDIKDGVLTVRAASSKSGKTIHIPLNKTARKVLATWQKQTRGDGETLVFPSPKGGGRMDNCSSAWIKLLKDAGIENFRWHDMRHDFASRLVMAGVDLNTVRELLGHADMKMTLRYAHLAPQATQRAVEALD
ncbi:MAG: site-specific integrase [Fretibacterium sp.]|nr:site-specific integrase [Fretibacterium sp.]